MTTEITPQTIEKALETEKPIVLGNGYSAHVRKYSWSKETSVSICDQYSTVSEVWSNCTGTLLHTVIQASRLDPPKRKDLYRFSVYCGRMGELEGHFFASEEEIAEIETRSIYFGEVLGKHSEIVADPGEINFTRYELSEEAEKAIIEVFGTYSGHAGSVLETLNEEEE